MIGKGKRESILYQYLLANEAIEPDKLCGKLFTAGTPSQDIVSNYLCVVSPYTLGK